MHHKPRSIAPQNALEAAQSTLGDDHPMTVSLLGHLARACAAQGKDEFASKIIERQVHTRHTANKTTAMFGRL